MSTTLRKETCYGQAEKAGTQEVGRQEDERLLTSSTQSASGPGVAPGPVYRFVLPVAPRTKKTSDRIVHVGGFHKKLPSKAFVQFFNGCMSYALLVKSQLWDQGIQEIPIRRPVKVWARYYLDRNTGPDECGLNQALGDTIQAPKWKKQPNGEIDWRRQLRDGMGIIDDDKLIRWQPITIEVDHANPRVEVELEIL